jgi:hypothetical protein
MSEGLKAQVVAYCTPQSLVTTDIPLVAQKRLVRKLVRSEKESVGRDLGNF